MKTSANIIASSLLIGAKSTGGTKKGGAVPAGINFFAILFIVFGLISSAVSQNNCKYLINDIDKTTNKLTKQTEFKKIIHLYEGEKTVLGEISIKRIDTSYYFVFNYEFQKAKSGIEVTIRKGEKLIFLLENQETITLKAVDEIKGDKKKMIGVYYCNLNNVCYATNKAQLNKLFSVKVKSIRVSNSDSFGEEVNNIIEVKEKRQEVISDLVKCAS